MVSRERLELSTSGL